MFNLDNQIKICPECKGWGLVLGKEDIPCKSCNGKGVSIQIDGENLYFDLPTFIDFGNRKRLKYLRALVSGGIITFGITIILVLIFIIIQVF